MRVCLQCYFNTQFFCITVYVHRLIYSVKMISLPFPQEARQGNEILTHLLINVSNEVTYLCETGPSMAILARGIRALFAKLLLHRKLCMSFNILECLIFLLRSRESHAYVTQQVLPHSDERMSSCTKLCAFLVSSYL